MTVISKQNIDRFSKAKVMFMGRQVSLGVFRQAILPAPKTANDNFLKRLPVMVFIGAIEKGNTEKQDAGHVDFIAKMTTPLDQSQVETADKPRKPKLLGWVKKPLTRPSNPQNERRSFKAIMQYSEEFNLDCKTPMSDGNDGHIRAYVTYRPEQPQTDCTFGSCCQSGIAFETQALLLNYSRHRQIEYCITATNGIGISVPGNMAAVAL